MSEEEKKSFEELKKEINKPLEVPEDKCNTFILYNIDNAKIIVNLIEKQQKEIQNLQTIDKEHQKLNGELREEIDDLKQLMAHKNSYTKQLEEDLFENASNYVVSKDKIRDKIEYYKKIDNAVGVTILTKMLEENNGK